MKRWFILKLLLTLLALGFIARSLGRSSLAELSLSDPASLAGAVAALFVGFSVNAVRWRAILTHLDVSMTLKTSLRLVLIGQFFNQTLPSSVGGDAVRAWAAWRGGAPAPAALASVLADRVSGVMALALLSLVTLIGQPAIGDSRVLALIVLVLGGGVLGLAGLAGLTLVPERWLERMRLGIAQRASRLLLRALFTSRGAFAILLASLGIALLNCLTVALIARGLGIGFSPGAAFLAVPIALLASAVPVTIAGWGVREAAMVVMLGLYGIAPVAALSISVLLGVLNILCGLPGGLIWLIGGREKPRLLVEAAAGES